MLGATISDTFSATLVNAILFALWAIPPVLLIGYMRQIFAARRVWTDFSLRKLETIELDRATLLYEKVSNRLKDIEKLGTGLKGSWRSRYRHRARIRQQYGDELLDLTAYAQHLRALIIRVRRRPIQRLRARVHTISSRFAFSHSLVLYFSVLVVLVAIISSSQQPAWADELAAFGALLFWKPIDQSLLYANAVAAGIVAVTTPVFYVVRRVQLQLAQRSQIRSLKEFAGADPDRLIQHAQDGSADRPPAQDTGLADLPQDQSWFSILEVAPSATMEDVKEAYKFKIKQNHPDRVHDMAPIFRQIAEDETKKLNAAYEEALMSLRPLEFECEPVRG